MTNWKFRCERCGVSVAASQDVWHCVECGGPLAWVTERRFARDDIDAAASGLWRYARTLPVPKAQSISLGEVTTPMVDVDVAGVNIRAKLDFFSPSGSYKDRGASVLISALRQLGATHAVEDSSGNAAAAIAAYAAAAGMNCTVFAPATASPGKLVQAAAYGASVERINGNRDDVAAAAIERASGTPGATYASHNWHPFFIEGVKTWAFEVWEQLGFRVPDAVVAPVGSGSMLLGAYLAFDSLKSTGEIERAPRLYATQPAACAPVVAAIETGASDTTPFPRSATLAEGASIANPVRGRELLRVIRATNGGAMAVTEAEIARGFKEMAAKGIYVEPTSAVAIAGARRLIETGEIAKNELTVVVLSGSGLKATDAIRQMLEE
jgi:threonine synthase